MAISNEELALLEQARALIVGQTVFTDESTIGYALNEIQRFLSVVDFEAPEIGELSIVIYAVSDILSRYKEGDSKEALVEEIMAVCGVSQKYGFATIIASDGSFVFEGQDYSTGLSLNTVNIGYTSSLGTAPTQKTKTSYLYTTYTLTANDLPVLMANNATFKGWTLDGVVVNEGTTVSGNVTLVADWEVTAVNYTISYQTAHGTAPNSKSVTVNVGESYTLTTNDLPIITADGYIFGGWTLNGVLASVGDTISDNSTLVAVWEKADTEFDWDSFVKGYHVGAALRRKRRLPEKEPVAYLYNGVRMPPLPKWDKTAYPYATIHSLRYWVPDTPQYGMVIGATLTITTVPVRAIGDALWATVDGDAIIYRINTVGGVTDDDWVRREDEDFSFVGNSENYDGEVNGGGSNLTWSNYDVLDYVTGEVELAASEPIPVYE